MILSRTSRLPMLAGLLCLLLLGFAGASFGAVRFDSIPSPTEVINTARSDVTGGINLIVRGTGNVTGTAAGGSAQIGIIYTNPNMQIDNTTTTGIKIFYSSGFASTAANCTVGTLTNQPCVPSIVLVENFDFSGKCTGRITINLPPGATPAENDFIRVEGVRGRIDLSPALTPNTDLYAALQSINDPSANSFNPDVVRVAKSLDGLNVKVVPDTLLLCYPTTGRPGVGGQTNVINAIMITEGFARAFVDYDAGDDGAVANDRVDSGMTGVAPARLGSPTNSTQFIVWLDKIPASVSGIIWDASVGDLNTGAQPIGAGATLSRLVLISSTGVVGGASVATYSYESFDQVNKSDVVVEYYRLQPQVVLISGALDTGVILAGVALGPAVTDTGCTSPGNTKGGVSTARPRFSQMFESDDISTNNNGLGTDDPLKPYINVNRCSCYMLFTYTTAAGNWNTGIAVANTTGDTAVFLSQEAPDQSGGVTFYLYDVNDGYAGTAPLATGEVKSGRTGVALLSDVVRAAGITKPFSGYVFAKADFQFCHGFAYLFDDKGNSQGYLANIVPDPTVKGNFISGVLRRTPADAGDNNLNGALIPAGEGLNN